MSSNASQPQAGPSQFLRCNKCGKTVTATLADLLQYTRTHWPTCCGEVMVLVTQTEQPQKPDSR
jgi:hypothetical protein